MPNMVDKAVATDKNRDTLWQDTIQKEMENVKSTFQTIPKGKKLPSGFQYVNCPMMFDIKMNDFWRVASLVARGYMACTLDIITYSSVLTREAVCIALTMTA